jgi:PAS domain S-box-containing protein
MSNPASYDELLKQYRDLQLRVTRFSAIEQELINTRDRLDHELVLHQRLHQYNSDALNETTESAFFQLETEAIVDVFETESSLIIYAPSDGRPVVVYREGFSHANMTQPVDDIKKISSQLSPGKSHIVKSDVLNTFDCFSAFEQGLFSYFREPNLHYEVYLCGLISKTNAPLYIKPQERHLTIFGVFTQQLQAMLANRKRSEEITNQMEQIKASQQELRKLSLIATRTKSGVIIADNMGRIEWVNDAFTKISGYRLEEIIGQKPKDLLQGPKTDETTRQQLKEALWKKENIEVTVVNYDREGREYFNQLEIISVFDEDGNHTNFIALQKDITEETLARQEILRMNTRFELIAKHSRIGTWEYSTLDNSVRWNDIMYDIYGASIRVEQSIVDIWRNSMSQEDYEKGVKDMDNIRNGMFGTQESTFRIKRASDGAERTVETLMVAERDENGQLLRVVGSTKDITEELNLKRERDAAAERMVTLKTFYESILNHSPSQKYVFDPEGRIMFSSAPPKEGSIWWDSTSKRSIFEMAETDVSARTWNLLQNIRKSVETKQIIRVEDEGAAEDGTTIQFLQSILPYQNVTGQLEHIIVTGVDISELIKVQEAVNRKNDELQKINAELDNFVYSISHDLRSPLLSIKGIVSLIMHSSEIDEKTQKYLEMVDGSATRLDGTIQEILEYSRNSRLDLAHETFNVVAMVQQSYNDLRFSAEGQMELLLDIQTDPFVVSDKSRLGVLLKNIIGNSIKYRRKDIDSFVQFSLARKDGKLIMKVTDNGEGINAQHLDKIFSMFYRGTTSSIGTGLGLYICKEIVNKLNGDLLVESTPGQGTTMTITLPEIAPHE